jgi:periplasmic protein TonB
MPLRDKKTESRRLQDERRRTARESAAAAYTIRLMGSLAGSLLLIIAAVHLPILDPPGIIGWEVVSARERLTVEIVDAPERRQPAGSEVPITVFNQTETPAPDDEAGAEYDIPVPVEQERRIPQAKRMSMRVLEFADTMPQIQGGISNYYLNIEYPPEAQAAGIEGRLVLSFVVETNGQLSEVEVVSSLHPLCDSAAVRALRDVRFVPGMQNGVAVRVRMHLPVRFELLNREKLSSHPQQTGEMRRSSTRENPRRRQEPA